MTRDSGLEDAIRAAGGVGALARAIGIAQPSVSTWRRVPSERVLQVEEVTGVPRSALRPDLYPDAQPASAPTAANAETVAIVDAEVDPLDAARADEYSLLATLLRDPPDAALLGRLARLGGDDATPLGEAHAALARAAATADPARLTREFFDLFIGVGRGELLPYASYYLTGFLHERPLARVRADLARLGLAADPARPEPEDHLATLCELMATLIRRGPQAEADQQAIFERHLAPWAERFFKDLERAEAARFYRAVGKLGRTMFDIEQQAFALPA